MVNKSNIGSMIWKVAKELATPVAFLDQISAKDRETLGDSWSNAPITQKLKILTNIVGGRITGINLFKDEVQAPQTINFGGIFNRWTGLGAALLVYSFVAKGIKINGSTLLPHGSKLAQIGKRLLTGGAFGGIFDAPADGSKAATGTRHIQLAGSNSISQTNTTFHNTSHGLVLVDSGESSFR